MRCCSNSLYTGYIGGKCFSIIKSCNILFALVDWCVSKLKSLVLSITLILKLNTLSRQWKVNIGMLPCLGWPSIAQKRSLDPTESCSKLSWVVTKHPLGDHSYTHVESFQGIDQMLGFRDHLTKLQWKLKSTTKINALPLKTSKESLVAVNTLFYKPSSLKWIERKKNIELIQT